MEGDGVSRLGTTHASMHLPTSALQPHVAAAAEDPKPAPPWGTPPSRLQRLQKRVQH
jgi:hypothetical protein